MAERKDGPRIVIRGAGDRSKISGGNLTTLDNSDINVDSNSNTEVIVEGLGEGAEILGGSVTVNKGSSLNVGREGGKTTSSDGEAAGSKGLPFEDCTRIALLMSGTGTDSHVFESDVGAMKTLLTGANVGISEDDIYTVVPRPNKKTTTWKLIENEVEKIRNELEDKRNSFFIFYYSGHFFKDKTYRIDGKGHPATDRCSDTELADLLITIPVKYMLCILDMCSSSSAEVHAKNEDGPDNWPEPCLFEALAKRPNAKGGGEAAPSTEGPEKIVQWSSSRSYQESYNLKNSFFTKHIIEEITQSSSGLSKAVGPGNYLSVLQVNKHVSRMVAATAAKFNKCQDPVIKPDYADDDYFQGYPYFAKTN